MNRLLPITIKMGALALSIVLVIAFLCIADTLVRKETIPSAVAATPGTHIPQELAVGAILPRPTLVKAEAIRFDARRLIFAKIGDQLSLELGSLPQHSTAPQAQYKSTNESIATVDENGDVTAVGWGECRIVATSGDFSTECTVNVAKKWIALTFDDGPRGTAKAFLKELKKKHAIVTFFILGELADSKSGGETLQQMASDGHEVGNHSYDHTGDPAKLAKQIPKTDKIIKDATGKTVTLLRPPYGKLSDTTKNSGELVITWNVDSFDWKSRNADAIVDRVMGMVSSGDIVLMHDIYSTTTSAALRIISALKEKGYTFVTVSDILEEPIQGKVYNSGTKEVRTMKVLYE